MQPHPDLNAWRTLLDLLPQGVLVADALGRIVEANPGAARILGMAREDLLARDLADPRWAGLDEDGAPLPPEAFPGAATLATRVPFHHQVIGLLQDGRDPLWLAFSGGPLPDGGVLVTFADITDQRRTEEVHEARARLVAAADGGTLEEVLQAALDQAEHLTGSRIGFFHFIGPDERTLGLQAWSTRTREAFCQAEVHRAHYPVAQAGVWVDALRDRRPVIHNDYAALAHRRGLPEGHAEVVRELVVPVFRGERIVALLGVGNKPGPYGTMDVETLQQFADFAWDPIDRLRGAQDLEDREASLSALVSSVPGAVYRSEVGAPWRMLMCSEGFLEVVGHSPEDFLAKGLTYAELIHPEDLEALDREVAAGVEGRRNYQLEYRIIHPGGTVRWVLERGRAQFDPGGDPRWRDGVILDITDRKQAEESLRKASAAVEQSPHAVVVTNTAGRIEYVNAAFVRSTGYTAEEVLGQNPRILNSGEHDEAFFQSLWGDLLQGRTWAGRIRNKRKNGELYWEQTTISPLRDAQGRLTHFVASKEDITGRLRAEAALQASEARLRALAESAPDTLLLLDLEGRIQYLNRALPGLPWDGALGRDWLDWLPEGSRPAARQALAAVLEGRSPAAFAVEAPAPDPAVRQYGCRLSLVEEAGSVSGLALFVTDPQGRGPDGGA